MAKPLASAKRNQLLQKAVRALETGNAAAAYKAAVQVAKSNPADVDALIMLSQAAPGAGRINEALHIFSVSMKSVPPREDALICWGNLRAAAGDLSGAESAFRHAAKISPASIGAQLNLANALLQSGQAGEAIAIFVKVSSGGGGWQACYGLANAYLMTGDMQKAEQAFVAVLETNPGHVGALNGLGRILIDRGFYDQAETHLVRARKLQPNNPGVILNLGSLKRRQGATDESILLIKRAIELNPSVVTGYSNLADVMEMANRLDEAETVISDGLTRFPGHSALLLQAARLDRRHGRIQKAIDRLVDITDKPGDFSNAAARQQELGVLYDKLGNPAKAFECFTLAKESFAALSRQLGIGSKLYFDQVSEMHEFVKKTEFSALDPLETNDGREDPCFMIGFLRSGTTLLHQIVDSHPDVVVVDESPMSIAAMKVLENEPGGYPDGIATLDDSTARRARNAYFETLDVHIPSNSTGTVVIDKFPFNTTRAPLLWRLFPKARFVFSVRHPMDVCLSCFMQAFQPSIVTSPFLNMADTVRAYTDLMDMWLLFSSKANINYLNVRYEDLVANQEQISRQLFEFLGVSWDDRALKFYEHAQQSASVSNPSYHQVVRPIYSDATQRWRRYDQQLAPFHPKMRPYISEFGYEDS